MPVQEIPDRAVARLHPMPGKQRLKLAHGDIRLGANRAEDQPRMRLEPVRALIPAHRPGRGAARRPPALNPLDHRRRAHPKTHRRRTTRRSTRHSRDNPRPKII